MPETSRGGVSERLAQQRRVVGYLRRKLGRDRIQTMRGMGYMIAPAPVRR
ncbi:MAG TPA: hypothetical protein VGR11_16630 [Solirubrobacteraceae bacterium]|nr:hypothetical protein [Solirubrobacteraceae bacterium]